MGLAPYGDHGSDEVARFVESIKAKLIEIAEDGSVWLNQKYFAYAAGLRMAKESKWERLFGFPKRKTEAEFNQQNCNLALAIQRITEETVIKMAKEAKRLTGSDNLCLAGGVALNCVANGKLQNSGLFNNIFIQPAAGDAGGAVGAALSAHHIYLGKGRESEDSQDQMKGAYLGPEYSDKEILDYIERYEPVYDQFSLEQLNERVVEALDSGKVVGWFQGRMEFGPRALGNRSILGDARNPDMQKRLNLKIKYRESFRPFAPSVIDEARSDYFELETSSPYMLLVQQVVGSRRKQQPENFESLAVREKLYHLRSDIPAITHVDFSARIQTVHKATNPRYWELISCFQKKTGYGLLVNTSFNVRGEPIVCTPADAYRCFMRTEMDYMAIGNFLFDKTAQPEWFEKDDWREEHVLD